MSHENGCPDVVDGSNIKALVDNEGAFKKFVNQKFNALDSRRTGDLSSQELKPAVLGIGGALGLPPKGSSPETDPIYDQVMKSFRSEKGGKVTKEKFSSVLREILLGLADGLEREPIKVITLDGKKLREYARHSDAEVGAVNTFVENDKESTGKVRASVLRHAFEQVSVESGAPPPGEASMPVIDAALRRLQVDEDSLVDQNQFVELFHKLLLELSGVMAEKPLTVAHIEKVFDGQSVKAFLSDKKSFKEAVSEVWLALETGKHGPASGQECLIYGLDALAPRAGLPPLGAVEEVDLEMKEALKMIENGENSHSKDNSIDKHMFEVYLAQVLGGIMLQLEGKPIVISSSAIVNEAQAGNPDAIF